MSLSFSTLPSFIDLIEPIQDNFFSDFVIRQGYEWYCQLCNAGPMGDYSVANRHLNGGRHKSNFAKLNHVHCMARRTNWVKSHASAIDSLSAASWKMVIKELCYDFILCEDSHQQDTYQKRVLDSLRMYVDKEKLTLLELAIWKGRCLGAFAEATNTVVSPTTSLKDIDEYWTSRDEAFNSVEFRRGVRVRCGSAEVVNLVLPFLGRKF